MRDLAGESYLSRLIVRTKGVVVFLDQELARAQRTDVHASQLRRMDVRLDQGGQSNRPRRQQSNGTGPVLPKKAEACDQKASHFPIIAN